MPSEPLLPLQQQKILGCGEGTCLRYAHVKMSWSEKNTLCDQPLILAGGIETSWLTIYQICTNFPDGLISAVNFLII